MNRVIRNQLENVSSVKLEYAPTDIYIHIPKTIKVLNNTLKKGGIYDIKLSSSVTNHELGSMLASNWNNGKFPEYDKYTVEVEDNMAKMVKVNGVAIENNSSQFYGWLPHDSFEVIKIY